MDEKQVNRSVSVSSILKTFRSNPFIIPFESVAMKLQSESPINLEGSIVALFNRIIEKINKTKEDQRYGVTINGIYIKINTLDILEQLFYDSEDFYRYILAGYFSQNDSECFQRLVTYLHMLVKCWESDLCIAQDSIRHDASKGDGWMMKEAELKNFVKQELSFIGCYFKISPTLITEGSIGSKEFHINYAKIIEDELYKDPTFIEFKNRRFSKEAAQLLATLSEEAEKLVNMYKEFKINKYLSLKLERCKTNIYVDYKYFMQCKFLLLNIPIGEISSLDQISSIDEAEQVLDKSLEGSEERQEFVIAPETEFWAHCSNLQAWYENNYDTRLLHRNIAFHLLHNLAKAGDIKAKNAFKEEIAERLGSGSENVTEFLISEGYINFLSYEERITAVLNPAEADALLELEASTGNPFIQAGSWEYFNTGAEPEPFQQFLVRNKSVIALLIYWYEKPNKPLPESISAFKRLERLIYMGENISKFPESIKELKLLKYLYVSSETLDKFPDFFTEITSLESLFVDSPVLTEFPEMIGNLKNLRELGLGKNIEKIPKSISNLRMLENLYLNGNPLRKLPKFIYSLKSVKRLNIRNIKLEEISDSISELENLEYLNIKKNNIKRAPETLLKLNKLKTLIIDQKDLTEESVKILNLLKKRGVLIL